MLSVLSLHYSIKPHQSLYKAQGGLLSLLVEERVTKDERRRRGEKKNRGCMDSVTRYDLASHQGPVSGESLVRCNWSPCRNTIVGVARRRQSSLSKSQKQDIGLLWKWLQYLGQLVYPCFKFLFVVKRRIEWQLVLYSWAQCEVWKIKALDKVSVNTPYVSGNRSTNRRSIQNNVNVQGSCVGREKAEIEILRT